jgi:molybdopterin molybdotransferase
MESRFMPEFEEARRIILEHVAPLGAERVELLQSLGRVLTEDVFARWDLPSFDNSSMDGYAVRAADCQGVAESPGVAESRGAAPLSIIDCVSAGGHATKSVLPGTAIKIMTGAPLPPGGDSIVPFEDAEQSGGTVRAVKPVTLHQHVRFAGENVRQGKLVLAAGALIRPYEINMLACCGEPYVSVVRRPTVAIVSTGDELVPLGQTPSMGQIVNSNSYSLAASITSLGALPVIVGIARDNLANHREKLSEGLKADVLITSAGVSVGDRDLVREVLGELGAEIVFWRVRVKPGKALAFGSREGKPIFALPGNPVSSMMTFDEFVAPALLKMMGHKATVMPLFPAVLQSDLKKRAGQTHLVRVRLEYAKGRYLAWSAGKQDTGVLTTMLQANAIAVLPPDRDFVAAGEEIQVHLLGQAVGMTAL